MRGHCSCAELFLEWGEEVAGEFGERAVCLLGLWSRRGRPEPLLSPTLINLFRCDSAPETARYERTQHVRRVGALREDEGAAGERCPHWGRVDLDQVSRHHPTQLFHIDTPLPAPVGHVLAVVYSRRATKGRTRVHPALRRVSALMDVVRHPSASGGAGTELSRRRRVAAAQRSTPAREGQFR